MRIKEIKCYQFDELSDKAKQNAINHFSDINTDYDWWNWVYEDAAFAGIKINGFDVGYRQDIEGKLTSTMEESIKYILANHGDQCDTYITAKKYQDKLQLIKVKSTLLYSNEDEMPQEVEDEIQELEEEYLDEILSDYWKRLKDTYEYDTSEEAIKESIINGEYEFDEDGDRI